MCVRVEQKYEEEKRKRKNGASSYLLEHYVIPLMLPLLLSVTFYNEAKLQIMVILWLALKGEGGSSRPSTDLSHSFIGHAIVNHRKSK